MYRVGGSGVGLGLPAEGQAGLIITAGRVQGWRCCGAAKLSVFRAL